MERPITKRTFLGGFGSLFVAGVAGKVVYDNEPMPQPMPAPAVEPLPQLAIRESLAPTEDGEVNELMYAESNSSYFDGDAAGYKPQFETDMPVVLDRMEVLATIVNHFYLPNIASPALREELESLIVGIAIEESRLDTDALNTKTKAFSCLQIVPKTWDDLVRPGESKDSLIDVIKVSARLMEQSYQHITSTCRAELDQIKTVFFAGDTNQFELDFLAPLIANSYNAGMGSLASLVKWFAQNFTTRESTLALLEEADILTGRDVFLGMTKQAFIQGDVVTWYKEQAASYTPKVYAAREVVRKYVSYE